MKSTLAIIAALAISTVFAQDEQTPPPPQEQYQYSPPPQVQYQYLPPQQATQTQHFTNSQRLTTMALNIVPGLGSFLIMEDYLGAGVQLYLSALGATSIILGLTLTEQECLEYATGFDPDGLGCHQYAAHESLEYPGLLYIGVSTLVVNAVFNVLRSMLYNEPTSKSASHATATQHNGFNLSILPNRKGEAMPYVMYNRSF